LYIEQLVSVVLHRGVKYIASIESPMI